MKKYFESEKTLEEFKFISPDLLYTFAALNQFCDINKIPVRVTSIVRSIDAFSTSKTHQTGRGIDISTKDWKNEKIDDVMRFLVGWDKLHEFGAISKSDGIKKIAVYHDNHIHLQVAP